MGLASEWAAAQTAKHAGDIGPLQDFINSQLAEPFEERERITDATRLLSHVGNYEAGTLPAGVQMITAGIDLQIDHIYVTIHGWGYMSEVWSIYEGRLESGDTSELGNYKILEQFLYQDWPMADDPDTRMVLSIAAIDCNYRGDVVFDFCRQCAGVNIVPVRGDDSVRTRMFRVVKVAGGTLRRYDLNLRVLKDRLYRLMFESATPGPGYFHLHADTDQETIIHRTAEEQRLITRRSRRREFVWVLKSEHTPNHIWDCDVYSSFAAELAGVRLLREPEEQKKTKRPGRGKKTGGFLSNLPDVRI